MSPPTPTNLPSSTPKTPTPPTKSANNCKPPAPSTSSNPSPPPPTACLELVPLASPLPPGVRSPHHARHRETRPRRILLDRTCHHQSSRRTSLLRSDFRLVCQESSDGSQ